MWIYKETYDTTIKSNQKLFKIKNYYSFLLCARDLFFKIRDRVFEAIFNTLNWNFAITLCANFHVLSWIFFISLYNVNLRHYKRNFYINRLGLGIKMIYCPKKIKVCLWAKLLNKLNILTKQFYRLINYLTYIQKLPEQILSAKASSMPLWSQWI